MLHQITPGLYRSALPDAEAIPILKSLGITTIVNLYQQSDSHWLPASAGIRQIHLPLRLGSMDDEDSLAVLRHISAAQADGAVLVHCRHGQNRTGVIAALWRILYQDWSAPRKLLAAFAVTALVGLPVRMAGWELPETITPIAWALLLGGVWMLLAEWLAGD